MVRPTRFNKKYSLIRKTTERTDTGGLKQLASSILYEDWCNKKPVNGKKRLDYTALGYNEPYTLTMRKRTDYNILPTDIIQLDSVDFQIASIIDLEMYYEIDVKK